jgi:alpha-L-rhamnosidase
MSVLNSLRLLIILLVSSPAFSQYTMVISDLRCEGKSQPTGIPLAGFRLSWKLQSDARDKSQGAYEIIFYKQSLAQKEIIWDSGRVPGDNSIQVFYNGPRLQPASIYFWKVRVWDESNGSSEWSEPAKFITGLFSTKDWSSARWIVYEDVADSALVVPGVDVPNVPAIGTKCMKRSIVPYFRKNFSVRKQVDHALVFISGMGQYELRINGKQIGNSFMAPGWTDYSKRKLYNTYDITTQITKGSNAIGVVVGNGFFNINRERYFKFVSNYGSPRLIFKMAVTYTDGSKDILISDESWQTAPSPILYSSIYGGEDYDARAEQPGWDKPNFDFHSWKSAIELADNIETLLPEIDNPVRLMDTLETRSIIETRKNTYLYDFHQNTSGIIRLRVKGTKNQTIILRPAELVDSVNLISQSGSGSPYYFTYTLKGDGIEEWTPSFTYYGFRYVQVENAVPSGTDNPQQLAEVITLSILHNRNSADNVGTFTCSNKLFNDINHLIKWAIKSNMQSVLTDCPHREKLGWLEQAHLMGGSVHYNFDIYNLYRKTVFDMIDAQRPSGLVPDIAPEFVVFDEGFVDSPEWGSSAIILPWQIYQWYSDSTLLKTAYPMMKKYLLYLGGKSQNNLLTHGLGDWCDYGPKPPGESQLTPKSLTATAVYYQDIQILQRVAFVLNEKEDETYYNALSEKVRSSFNSEFFSAEDFSYSTGSQTSLAMPLAIGLVEDRLKASVVSTLIESIKDENFSLTAGDVGFHYLVKSLEENNKPGVLFRMNNRDDVPGYGYQIKHGATSLTESWSALTTSSNNHLMLGHLMEWFYSGLLGISQENESTGYKKILIRPQPVGDISWASGYFRSPYGDIKSSWTLEENVFRLNINIPVNARAKIILPYTRNSTVIETMSNQTLVPEVDQNAAVINVGSGSYSFVVTDSTGLRRKILAATDADMSYDLTSFIVILAIIAVGISVVDYTLLRYTNS